MDLQQFIASGLVELYALGIATPAEAAQVKRMAAEYPQVQQELARVQESLERYGTLYTVQPPAKLRDRIIAIPSGVPNVPDPDPAPTATARPAARPTTTGRKPATTGKGGIPAWMFGILLALGVLITALVWYFLNRGNAQTSELEGVRTELAEQRAAFETLQSECAETRTALEAAQAQLRFIQNPNTNPVALAPLRRRRDPAQAIVYWNSERNQALVNPINLPAIDGNQTYQLWAETPRGLLPIGTFKNEPATLQAVDFEEGAVNLYVSLEPLGGSTTPTQGQVKLLGKI